MHDQIGNYTDGKCVGKLLKIQKHISLNLRQIDKVQDALCPLEESLSLLGMFQPTELNLQRLMLYKLGHSTSTPEKKKSAH